MLNLLYVAFLLNLDINYNSLHLKSIYFLYEINLSMVLMFNYCSIINAILVLEIVDFEYLIIAFSNGRNISRGNKDKIFLCIFSLL